MVHGAGSWSFGNDLCRNAVTFGVDNSLSSNIDNRRINVLEVGERDLLIILMVVLVQQRKV